MAFIHRARILDIARGMGVKAEQISKLFNARTNLVKIKESIVDFRKNFIDTTTPTILVLDIVDLAKLAGISNLEEFGSKLRSQISLLSGNISIAKFNDIVQKEFNLLNTKLDSYMGVATHQQYRSAFHQFGQNIDKHLYTKTVMQINDPENVGQAGKIVLIGKSFNALRDNCANKALNLVLKNMGSTAQAKDFAALGHTSASLSNNTIRINTPALYDRMLRLEAIGGLNQDFLANAEKSLANNVPIFVETRVTFNETFSKTAGILFDIGGSVVVYMDPTINSSSGSKEEKIATAALINEQILPDLATAIKSRFKYYEDKAETFKNSPSYPEYIAEVIGSTFNNTKVPNVLVRSTSSNKTKILAPIVKTIKVRVTTNRKLKSTNQSILGKTIASTVNLLAILQAGINKQVAKNMGQGNEHRVLNYRTGRFAESVQVQRLSESRQGMITAFYSYMRNPYGTFSEGGRQQFPKSRDPKLLISKSVRELAAPIVAARMRAVLI